MYCSSSNFSSGFYNPATSLFRPRILTLLYRKIAQSTAADSGESGMQAFEAKGCGRLSDEMKLGH